MHVSSTMSFSCKRAFYVGSTCSHSQYRLVDLLANIVYFFCIFHQQYISKIKGIPYIRDTEMSIFWMSINDALSVSWTINFGLFYCHIWQKSVVQYLGLNHLLLFMWDLRQDIIKVPSINRCFNGTFPWRNYFVGY